MRPTRVERRGNQIKNNDDLRLINIKKEDELFYNHKIFIVTWQRADTVEEVCKKLRISTRSAVCKAQYLRRQGIALKKFMVRIRMQDLPKLRALALKTIKGAPPTTADKFVLEWNRARSVADLCEKFNWSPSYVNHKASVFRSYGIHMKYFSRGRRRPRRQ